MPLLDLLLGLLQELRSTLIGTFQILRTGLRSMRNNPSTTIDFSKIVYVER